MNNNTPFLSRQLQEKAINHKITFFWFLQRNIAMQTIKGAK